MMITTASRFMPSAPTVGQRQRQRVISEMRTDATYHGVHSMNETEKYIWSLIDRYDMGDIDAVAFALLTIQYMMIDGPERKI